MDSLLSWSYFASQNNDKKKNRPMHFLDCHGQLQKKHKCTIQGTLCIPENGIILSLFSVYCDRWLAFLKLSLAKEDEVWTHHWEDMGTDRGQPYLCTVINYSPLTLKDVANNWNILGWK